MVKLVALHSIRVPTDEFRPTGRLDELDRPVMANVGRHVLTGETFELADESEANRLTSLGAAKRHDEETGA